MNGQTFPKAHLPNYHCLTNVHLWGLNIHPHFSSIPQSFRIMTLLWCRKPGSVESLWIWLGSAHPNPLGCIAGIFWRHNGACCSEQSMSSQPGWGNLVRSILFLAGVWKWVIPCYLDSGSSRARWLHVQIISTCSCARGYVMFVFFRLCGWSYEDLWDVTDFRRL